MNNIDTHKPLFPRNSFLVINGITLQDRNNGGLKFDIEIKSGADKKIGLARVFIFNLSQDIEVGSEIKINFGYAEDVGEYGIYEVVKKNKYREDGDIVQELLCSERSKSTSKIVSISIDGNVRISDAIKAVCKYAGITIVSLELLQDKLYTNGYTCYEKAVNELRELVEDSGSKMILKSNNLYVYHKDFKEKIINLSFRSGLLKNPTFSEKIKKEIEIDKEQDNNSNEQWEASNREQTAKNNKEYDYDVICFPIHYIKKGDVLNIESETYNGFAQVREIEISLKDSWEMKLKVKVM
ncbi:MAG: hypothetical protein ACLSVP_02240 [Fusobacterium sp.]